MKLPVHLFNPAIGTKGFNHIQFRCGKMIDRLKEPHQLTQNYLEVTCPKCLSYMNNPLRVLRRYGRITVIEGFALVLNHDFGYKYDIVVSIDKPGLYNVFVGINNKPETFIEFKGNFWDIAGTLADWYEKNLVPVHDNSQSPCPSRQIGTGSSPTTPSRQEVGTPLLPGGERDE